MSVFNEILGAIAESGVGSISDIEEQTKLSKDLIEQALKTMQRKGLLKKVSLDPISSSQECEQCPYAVMCKSKRRVMLLEITEKGKKYLSI